MRYVDLHVAVARALVAELRPVEVDPAEVRAAGSLVHSNPVVVDELAVGRRRRHNGIGPRCTIVVRARDRAELTARLWERIGERSVVDGDATRIAERAVRAEPRQV